MSAGVSAPKLVISLHDATPFHLERMRKAEAVFRDMGISKLTYLLVPEYHGSYPSAGHAEFAGFCRGPRPFAVEWHLHGYRHLETPPQRRAPGGRLDGWKRRFMTAGEGEFLALDSGTQRRKLAAGREAFRVCLGSDPIGFVAPAWLFNASLPPLLREMGFRFTEDHRRIYRLDTGAQLDSPVITWATRTFLRKYGSLIVCPVLARLWAKAPVLRVAVHPFDFDHPATVANIKSVLRGLMPGREQAFASELEFPGGGEEGKNRF
jgi:predicted deacetylase